MNFRKLLNLFHLEGYAENNPAPIYCICDAADSKKTVILGMFSSPPQMLRMHVTVYGYLLTNDPILTIDFMKEKHLMNVRDRNVQVSYDY